MEILYIENLSFTYPNATDKALNNISLSIEEGSFNVVCGESGCGKTTLLKMLKRELCPAGEKSGTLLFKGCPLEKLRDRESACEIGYVLQNPDNQIVTDKVWHELAFGLENMGFKNEVIRRRVGEMASYFGIQGWFRKKTDELSGGQKQLLNLASVMVMQPKVLILDEPTSQLDPIAASEFISTLQKMNRELGLTVILVEHRLEEVFPIADKVILMEKGKVLLYDTPYKIGSGLKNISNNHHMLLGLPSAVRIFNMLDVDDVCPLSVKEGKAFLDRHFDNKIKQEYPQPEYSHSQDKVIELRDVWFRYQRDLPDVMRGVSLDVFKGETFCILGGNGTGKTTTLNVISGLNKAYRGKVIIKGKKIKDYKGNELYRHNLALLPQNPQTVFLKSTVKDDFTEILKVMQIPKEQQENKSLEIAKKLQIEHLLNKHPYDLSGGEQQKCALAKILLSEPEILLLDEPTKGFDAYSKQILSDILKSLKQTGITILIVTHDVEFAAENADRCALFFDGEIISCDTPQNFFGDNNFYTTAANRISRHKYKGTVTCEQVVKMCRKNGERDV